MKKTIILCLSILLIALTGCKKDQNSWGKLAEGAVTVEIGKTVQLNFTHDGNVNPQWASEDKTIATVDANGLVTGVRVGSTIVSVNGLQCKVTVVDKYVNEVEPYQNWLGDDEMTIAYMAMNFGITTIPVYHWDTAYVKTLDTISVPGDTIVVTDTIPYPSEIVYQFETSLDGQLFTTYDYVFRYTPEIGVTLTQVAVMTDDGRASEAETYLKNRYIMNDGYCKVYNAWDLSSHIYDMGEGTILYSAIILEDE